MKKAFTLILLSVSCVLLLNGCIGDQSVPTYTDSSNAIETNVGREFTIALDANPTTGYNWNENFDDVTLKLVSKEYKPDEKAAGLVGAGGTQYYRFQARHLGSTDITLKYQRSWENAPIEQKIFKVNVTARANEGGKMSTKEYTFDGFQKIEVSAAFEVEIIQGSNYSVSITADDFPHIRVQKVGDTLQISRQGIEWFAPFHQQPKARITVPALEAVTFSGATKGSINNFQLTNDLAVKVSGASNLEAVNVSVKGLNVEVTGASGLKGVINIAGDARFEISGASRLELTGAANDIVLKVSGASRGDLINVPAHNADVDVSGASNGWVNLNGKFDANVSGASNLTWTGNPTMGNINTSGASNLRRK